MAVDTLQPDRAKSDQYREIIQNLLAEKARRGGDEEVEAQTLFDLIHDHYQVIYIGWHNKRRIFGPVLHLDIKDGKIWIQWNGTEDDIVAERVGCGQTGHRSRLSGSVCATVYRLQRFALI